MIRKAISIVFFACATFFGFAYYDRYHKWRDCFNDQGRCFDPETASVYIEGAGMVWGMMFVVTFIPAMVLWFKRPKSQDTSA